MLPPQVKGKSAFNFFNAEDLPWTTMAMRHSKFAAIVNHDHQYNNHDHDCKLMDNDENNEIVPIKNSLAVFASSSGEGSTVYRLLTQTGQYICLQVCIPVFLSPS